MRAVTSGAELMLAAGSGDCPGAAAGPAVRCGLLLPAPVSVPLGLLPLPRCHRGPLGAAVSCSQHRASLPPRCFSSEHRSAGMGLFLTISVAEVANFGRGQGRELEGAFMVGAFFDGGTVFPRQSKTLYGSSTVYVSSLVHVVHSNAIAL